jgi:hypothetical protein
MATTKELKELKEKFSRLKPGTDEYNTTLAKIKEAEAASKKTEADVANALATKKRAKESEKTNRQKTYDLNLIKTIEDYIQRQTDLGEAVSKTIQDQYNDLKKKYPTATKSITEPTDSRFTGYKKPAVEAVEEPKPVVKPVVKPVAKPVAKTPTPTKKDKTPPSEKKVLSIDEIIDAVANEYGSIDTIFKTDPGLKALLRKAIGKDGVPNTDDDLTPDQFVKELENTDWFKTNAGPVRQRGFYKRQFDELVAGGSDPEELYKTTEYGRGLKNTQQVIADEIVRVGGNLSPEDIELLSRDIYDLGYENQKAIVSQRIRAKISYKPGGIVGGQAGENLAELRKTAKANGLDLEKNFGDSVQGWLQKLAQGESVETFKQIIRGSAKIGLPEKVSSLLDQGVDLDTVYNPYKRLMASVLEINPESITLDDSVLRSAIGPDKEMSLYDYQKMLRKDNRWQYTNQAKEEVSNTALRVLRDFGFQG